MRPVPRSRHLPAVAVFVAGAAVLAILATADDRLSDRQVVLSSAALKAAGTAQFGADPLFAQTVTPPSPSPALSGAMAAVLAVTGAEPVTIFRVLVAPLVLIYLVGMYVLVYRQCLSWSVAMFIAILSVAVVPAMGGAFWGLGTLASMDPSGVCLAITPLVVLAFQDSIERKARLWRLPAVFLLIGLAGNFDLSWAVNLAIVLAACCVVCWRFGARGWLLAGAGLVAAAIGAMPGAACLLAARSAEGMTAEATAACSQMLRAGESALLYPQALRSLPGWVPWAGPAAVFVAVALSQLGRFRASNLRLWLVFAAASAVVASAFQAASQLAGAVMGDLPPVTGFVRASGLLMLPLYVLAGQALTSLFRLARGHYGLLRTACALAAAAWLIPSDSLRVPRHWCYQAAGSLMDADSRPRRLLRLREAADRQRELAAIARWARSETASDAVFITDSSQFRMLSQRSIVAGEGDGVYICISRPAMAATWQRRLAAQERVLHPAGGQADPAAITAFVGELAADQPFAAAGAWYVLMPASAAPQAGATLTAQAGEAWGRFYKVYRIR